MTRAEQIIEAGIDYTMSVRPMCVGGLAFEEDIRKMNRNKSFEEGAKWADKTMIEKACKYLSETLMNNHDNCGYVVVSSFDTITLNEYIEDFKKSMQEQL